MAERLMAVLSIVVMLGLTIAFVFVLRFSLADPTSSVWLTLVIGGALFGLPTLKAMAVFARALAGEHAERPILMRSFVIAMIVELALFGAAWLLLEPIF